MGEDPMRIALPAIIVCVTALAALAEKPTPEKPLNVNTATKEQLKHLDGIGDKRAQDIIDARPFSSVDELELVKGIGPVVLGKIRDRVTVEQDEAEDSPPAAGNQQRKAQQGA